MSNDKWFALHWKDGNITYGKGENIADVAHIGVGGLSVLDYWENPTSVPDCKKEIRLISLSGQDKVLPSDAMFSKSAREQILIGSSEVSVRIANRVWNCHVSKNDFQLVLTEY